MTVVFRPENNKNKFNGDINADTDMIVKVLRSMFVPEAGYA